MGGGLSGSKGFEQVGDLYCKYPDIVEKIRLKYRYLYLRRRVFAKSFKMRLQCTGCVRLCLECEGLIEIENPELT